MLRGHFDTLVEEARREVSAAYGERLVSLVLFGSVARATMGPESDIDLLVVADPLPDGRLARVAELDVVEERLAGALATAARDGVHTRLAAIFKTPREVERGSLLFLDMTDRARILFDRDGFFRAYLKRLSARLQELGSRRIEKGGGYYWLLKPDLKPGEVIEL